jgi:hypothetical protein
MKRGIDEAYLDLTQITRERIARGQVKLLVPHTHPEAIVKERQV